MKKIKVLAISKLQRILPEKELRRLVEVYQQTECRRGMGKGGSIPTKITRDEKEMLFKFIDGKITTIKIAKLTGVSRQAVSIRMRNLAYRYLYWKRKK